LHYVWNIVVPPVSIILEEEIELDQGLKDAYLKFFNMQSIFCLPESSQEQGVSTNKIRNMINWPLQDFLKLTGGTTMFQTYCKAKLNQISSHTDNFNENDLLTKNMKQFQAKVEDLSRNDSNNSKIGLNKVADKRKFFKDYFEQRKLASTPLMVAENLYKEGILILMIYFGVFLHDSYYRVYRKPKDGSEGVYLNSKQDFFDVIVPVPRSFVKSRNSSKSTERKNKALSNRSKKINKEQKSQNKPQRKEEPRDKTNGNLFIKPVPDTFNGNENNQVSSFFPPGDKNNQPTLFDIIKLSNLTNQIIPEILVDLLSGNENNQNIRFDDDDNILQYDPSSRDENNTAFFDSIKKRFDHPNPFSGDKNNQVSSFFNRTKPSDHPNPFSGDKNNQVSSFFNRTKPSDHPNPFNGDENNQGTSPEMENFINNVFQK